MYLNVPRLFSLADAYYVWFGDVIEGQYGITYHRNVRRLLSFSELRFKLNYVHFSRVHLFFKKHSKI